MRWVQANLPTVHATTNAPEPPLDYPASFFDAIYAISVLTHLPAGLQVAWMREFRQLLTPTGRLIVTTHGEGHVGYMLPDERERFEGGEMVVRNARSRGSNLCNAYHPPEWLRANLLDRSRKSRSSRCIRRSPRTCGRSKRPSSPMAPTTACAARRLSGCAADSADSAPRAGCLARR